MKEEPVSVLDNVSSANIVPVEISNNSGNEDLAEEPMAIEEPTAIEEGVVSENIPDAEITEEEIHNLLAGNYDCITNIFPYGCLDSDESRREGDIAPVADDRFSDFNDLKSYLMNIYVDEEVHNIMRDHYFVQQDELWMRTPEETEEIPAVWKGYQEGYVIEEVEVEGNQGKFVILISNPDEKECEYKLIFRATYEDGWRLNKMVSEAALCGYEEQGTQYTYKIWEIGDEDYVWCHDISVYDGEKLVQVITLDPPEGNANAAGIWEVDVNFDGKLDLMLFCGHVGNQCAAFYDCYVFDDGQFRECDSFLNPRIDEENQLIITHGRGSAISYEEDAYRIVGINSEEVWSKVYVYGETVGDYVIQREYYYEP